MPKSMQQQQDDGEDTAGSIGKSVERSSVESAGSSSVETRSKSGKFSAASNSVVQHYLEFVAQFFNGQMSIPKKIEKTEIVGEETHPGPVVLNIQSFATPYEGRKAQVLADIWDAICAYFNQENKMDATSIDVPLVKVKFRDVKFLNQILWAVKEEGRKLKMLATINSRSVSLNDWEGLNEGPNEAEVQLALASCSKKFFRRLVDEDDIQRLIHSLLESAAEWVSTEERRLCVFQHRKMRAGAHSIIRGKPDEVVMVGVEGAAGVVEVCVGEVKLELLASIQPSMRHKSAEVLQLLAAMTARSENQGGAKTYGLLTDLFSTFFVTLEKDGTIEVTSPFQLTKPAEMMTREQRVQFLNDNLLNSRKNMSASGTSLNRLVKLIYGFVYKSIEELNTNPTAIHIASPSASSYTSTSTSSSSSDQSPQAKRHRYQLRRKEADVRRLQANAAGSSRSSDELQLQGAIGHGAFASVFQCRWSLTGETVAAKVTFVNDAQRELNVLSRVKQRTKNLEKSRIIDLRSSHLFMQESTSVHAVILLELFPGVDLQTLLSTTTFSLAQSAIICSQILDGLGFLHDECHVVHGDLSCRNVLLWESSSGGVRVKLIDFGGARMDGDTSVPIVQNFSNWAVEMVLGGHYGCPVDIWALGCTIFKVITGRSLFHARRKKKENLLAEMIAVLGEIPVEVVNEGRKSHRYFEENKSCELKQIKLIDRSRSLETLLRLDGDAKEKAQVVAFLTQLLTFDRRKRPSARQLLTEWSDWPIYSVEV